MRGLRFILNVSLGANIFPYFISSYFINYVCMAFRSPFLARQR